MEVKIANNGRISPIRTLRTMEPGESWEISRHDVNFLALRVSASRYGASAGKFFSVLATDPEVIRVVRIK